MSATWGEHQPAYYVATHTENKEVVVAVRGTWAVEDVVTDITALPVVNHPPPRLPPCSPAVVLQQCMVPSPFTAVLQSR